MNTYNTILSSENKFTSFAKKRLIIWTVAIITFYVFVYLMDPLDPIWSDYLKMPFKNVFNEFLWGLFFSIIISEVSIYIDHFLNKYLPWDNRTIKHLLIQCTLQIIGSILIVLIINSFFEDICHDLPKLDVRKEYSLLGQWIATNIVIALLISTFNTIDFLLKSWKETVIQVSEHKLKASEHKRAAMSAELQALKLQIDPHFIFNNLSVLSELILEDQQLGYEYSESFAKVYRYLLVNSKKDVITLKEELKFLHSYIYLTTKRIGEGVNFEITIHEKFKEYLIPPLALQFLVENALKHNQTSKLNPLKINIYTTEDKYLVVSNILIPLINKNESPGIGIQNIINRFEFLGERLPIINKTTTEFIAKIPLYENK
ncbi:histidine kinase [Chishuiella sp.]|uniref:sensor histidine kinase n=1 Tax=Chishuiella sp. TaxID=1969467 RepID=UPI0028B027F8|nr:histidine kinase [Chishuiella sp.]